MHAAKEIRKSHTELASVGLPEWMFMGFGEGLNAADERPSPEYEVLDMSARRGVFADLGVL
jgi:hypothetical protein